MYLEAEPAEYVTIARKDKNSDNWFIGNTSGRNGRISEISLGFLDSNRKYIATIYADGKDADYKTSPQSYTIFSKTVTDKSKLRIPVAASGGYAISIVPKQ